MCPLSEQVRDDLVTPDPSSHNASPARQKEDEKDAQQAVPTPPTAPRAYVVPDLLEVTHKRRTQVGLDHRGHVTRPDDRRETGERGGKLAEMTDKVTDHYSSEVKHALALMTRAVNFLIYMTIVVVIAGRIIKMYSGIYSNIDRVLDS